MGSPQVLKHILEALAGLFTVPLSVSEPSMSFTSTDTSSVRERSVYNPLPMCAQQASVQQCGDDYVKWSAYHYTAHAAGSTQTNQSPSHPPSFLPSLQSLLSPALPYQAHGCNIENSAPLSPPSLPGNNYQLGVISRVAHPHSPHRLPTRAHPAPQHRHRPVGLDTAADTKHN